jgi:hypothetical protein
MKHIPKRQWLGCAVATAAMLGDLDYEEVARHWPELNEARTRFPAELRDLLESVTDIPWKFSPCWHPQKSVAEFPFTARPVAAWIQDSPTRCRHAQWIVARGEIIHDPGLPFPEIVTRYPLRDWVVTGVIQPVRPDELDRGRFQKRMERLRGMLHGAQRGSASRPFDSA